MLNSQIFDDNYGEGEGDDNEYDDSPIIDLNIDLNVSVLESNSVEPETEQISKINMTIDLLSRPIAEIGEETALTIFQNVQFVGNQKYQNKRILRETGSVIQLLVLSRQYMRDVCLVVEGCKALSVMCVNENDNKRMLGCAGLCQDVVDCMNLHFEHLEVIEHCLKLVIDLCNSTVLSRPVVIGKSVKQSFVNVPSTIDNCGEFDTCNNRLTFKKVGICKAVCDLLFAATERFKSGISGVETGGAAGETEEKKEPEPPSASLICLLCKVIYTLCEHNLLSQSFGEAKVCAQLMALLRLNAHFDIVIAASYSLVVLCSDTKTGNKQRCNSIDIIPVILKNLSEYTENIEKYMNKPDFQVLLDRCFWTLLNLTQNCPPNVRQMQDSKRTREVLDVAMGSFEVGESSKARARTLYKRVYQGGN